MGGPLYVLLVLIGWFWAILAIVGFVCRWKELNEFKEKYPDCKMWSQYTPLTIGSVIYAIAFWGWAGDSLNWCLFIIVASWWTVVPFALIGSAVCLGHNMDERRRRNIMDREQDAKDRIDMASSIAHTASYTYGTARRMKDGYERAKHPRQF